MTPNSPDLLGFCLSQVFHPNIDLEGNICLNILREDWKPVLSISSIIYGLQFLFLVSHALPCTGLAVLVLQRLRILCNVLYRVHITSDYMQHTLRHAAFVV